MNEEVVKDKKIIEKFEKQEIKRLKKAGVGKKWRLPTEYCYRQFIKEGILKVEDMIDLYERNIEPHIYGVFKSEGIDDFDEIEFLRKHGYIVVGLHNIATLKKYGLGLEEMMEVKDEVSLWMLAHYFENGTIKNREDFIERYLPHRKK